jgi:ATP-dependent Clp protease protease subunit
MFTYAIDPRIKKTTLELLGTDPLTINVDKISGDMARLVEDQVVKIRNLGQPFIPVLMDSYGGSVYTGLGIREALLAPKLPVVIYVPTKAMSCGAFLTACGTKGYRYAAETATFMIHDVSSGTFGKLEDMKVDTAEASRLAQLIFSFMDQGCGKPAGYIQKQLKKRGNTDWYLTAPEAKKLGLIDHIGRPQFQMEASINFKLDGKKLS